MIDFNVPIFCGIVVAIAFIALWLERRYRMRVIRNLGKGQAICEVKNDCDYYPGKVTRALYEKRRNHIPKKMIKEVIDRDGMVCWYCKCDVIDTPDNKFVRRIFKVAGKGSRFMHIDHVISLVIGGLTKVNNLCVSCTSCNTKKSCWIIGRFVKPVIDFVEEHQRGKKVWIGVVGRRYRRVYAPV